MLREAYNFASAIVEIGKEAAGEVYDKALELKEQLAQNLENIYDKVKAKAVEVGLIGKTEKRGLRAKLKQATKAGYEELKVIAHKLGLGDKVKKVENAVKRGKLKVKEAVRS